MMHLFYADESGSAGDASQIFFVLAGISIFERQGYWISQEIDKIALPFNPADPLSVELHGSPMFSGKGIWRRFPKEARIQAIKQSLQVIAGSHPSNRIFAVAVRKAAISPQDSVTYAFEQLASRFDYYLQRLHRNGDTQRGVIIFDKSTYETTIQALATDFRTIGHTWGVLRNLAEVPLFLESKASRLIQVADLISYAIFRHFEHNDNRFFSIIQHRFDAEGGVIHGLHVK